MHTIALHIAPDHPAFAGHFPGQPLLPGVLLLAEVLEAVLDVPALARSVGPAPRIGAAKFLAPVRPGDSIGTEVEVLFKRETKNTEHGLITFRDHVTNQDGTLVFQVDKATLVLRKPASA